MTAARATSDLHLTPGNAEWVMGALRELRADAEERGGPTFILGDIVDQPQLLDVAVWNDFVSLVRSWPDRLILLAGNHDQYSDWRNALETASGKQCSVISVPTNSPYGALIPYVPPDKFAEAMVVAWEPKQTAAPPITWTHQGFVGAYKNAMRRDKDGVPARLSHGEIVITGHYHLPQSVGRVVYCGSPIQHSFAEEGQEKGWLHWDDLSDLVPTRVAYNVQAPRHHTLLVHPDLPDPELPGWFVEKFDRLRVKAFGKDRDSVKARVKDLDLPGCSVTMVDDAAAPVVAQGDTFDEVLQDYVFKLCLDKGRPTVDQVVEKFGSWR